MKNHYLQLALTPGLGPITIAKLVSAMGSAQRVTQSSLADLQSIEGIGQIKARTIHSGLKPAAIEADRELKKATSLGITLLSPEDPNYPPLLRHAPDPPAILYMLGNILPTDIHSLAIVGSRKCGNYGREQAERFSSLLATAGYTVVSGGARGIDSIAHRAALTHPAGRTIAVLGSGLDVPYPPENARLFQDIANRGAVLSEYTLGTPPTPENFPRRNRIVSGMSRGVLVVEADEKSGALITARQALDDHNRPVFAIPGRVDNPLSAGPHSLIRQGAILTTNLQDILDNLDPLPDHLPLPTPSNPSPQQPPPSLPLGLTPRQQSLLLHLTTDPLSVDHLIEQTSLPPSIILQELTFLTLKGVVRRVDGQTYALRSKQP